MDSEDQTFAVYLRRQFRFGSFKLALDAVGPGYQPKALLSLHSNELSLIKVNSKGMPLQGTSILPRAWTWRWPQVASAQFIVIGGAGWGGKPTRYGLRLDIPDEAFYPLLASYAPDSLAQALQDHGVAVDRTPRRLNWFLTGWR